MAARLIITANEDIAFVEGVCRGSSGELDSLEESFWYMYTGNWKSEKFASRTTLKFWSYFAK